MRVVTGWKIGVLFYVGLVAGVFGQPAGPLHERIEKTFPFPAGGTFALETYRGAVTVEESDGTEARVTVDIEVEADSEEAARRARAKLTMDFAAAEQGVTVTVRNRDSRMRFVWDETGEIDLIFRVKLPRRSHADLKVTNGSITVGNLIGDVRAAVENGNMFLKRIDGSIDARANFGEVVISRCTGDVSVRVMRGLIRTGTIGGRADLKNGSGDVEIMTAYGEVQARATAGSVSAGFPRRVRGGATLLADGGNVQVKIDPEADCAVEAAARWGRVRVTTLPLQITAGASGENRLEGRLNAGGPRIQIRADGGSVTLERGATVFELEPTRPAVPERSGAASAALEKERGRAKCFSGRLRARIGRAKAGTFFGCTSKRRSAS